MVRFPQQYEVGIGDYTKEREKWQKGLSVRSIAKEIKGKRKTRYSHHPSNLASSSDLKFL